MQIFYNKLVQISKMDFINSLNSFIDTHTTETILVKDISDYFKMSRASLYNYAKNYLDCGLNEYIINRKVEQVKKLLCNSDMKIIEISEKFGFSDYN